MEETSDLKTQLEEGRKIDEGMRKKYKEKEYKCQILNVYEKFAREELERTGYNTQSTTRK